MKNWRICSAVCLLMLCATVVAADHLISDFETEEPWRQWGGSSSFSFSELDAHGGSRCAYWRKPHEGWSSYNRDISDAPLADYADGYVAVWVYRPWQDTMGFNFMLSEKSDARYIGGPRMLAYQGDRAGTWRTCGSRISASNGIRDALPET